MTRKIKVLFVAAECAPLAKAGGLGDVIGSLPAALNKIGCDTRVLLPFYGLISRRKLKAKKIYSSLPIVFNHNKQMVNIWRIVRTAAKPTVYLIENKKYFSRPEIYGQHNTEKFLFFSVAVVPILSVIDFKPDIIHIHDWQTGLISILLKNNPETGAKIKTVFTIHNLKYQGKCSAEQIHTVSDQLEVKKETVNFMAEGIKTSQAVTAVSPTYAKEILGAEYGCGLENILRRRKNNLYGIVNGLDINFFNPAADRYIERRYSAKSLSKKAVNKIALQKNVGLPTDSKIAVVGIVSRLTSQKGLDLLTENVIKLLDCQIIILGTGQKEIGDDLRQLFKKYPQKISLQNKFDEGLAHLIYAGADIFLMPSRYEPCGLGQMIAMRYGTVPVVRSTGGLKDTVDSLRINNYPSWKFLISNFQFLKKSKSQNSNKLKIENCKLKIDGNGFSFKNANSRALFQSLRNALNIYYNYPLIWRQLQINGMKQDFSWREPAKKYLGLYKKLLNL